jgi:hypothetical protein
VKKVVGGIRSLCDALNPNVEKIEVYLRGLLMTLESCCPYP